MVRFVAVVPHANAKTWPRAAEVALITVATPGCTVAGRPAPHALHLSFDTLAGELEAASLRVPQAAPAVPFTIDHARTLAAFLSALHGEREPIGLLVCESEGCVRSVTIGRWAANRIGCPLHESAAAAAVASCMLMDSVLVRVTDSASEVSQRMPIVADWAVQP